MGRPYAGPPPPSSLSGWLKTFPRLLGVLGVLASPCLAWGAPSAAQILETLEPGPHYQKLAVHLGASAGAKRDLFITDTALPQRIPIAFGFWVLRHEKRTILIDAGFTSSRQIAQWKIQGHRPPKTALLAEGIAPESVTDIVITHNHWDHIGGVGTFPKARIWITATELRRTLRWAETNAVRQALVRAKAEGRIQTVEKMQTVAPGIVVVPLGLHTPGFQFVVVHSPRGPWVFASDIAPLRANVVRLRPTGQTSDRRATKAVLQTMSELVGGDLSRLIPGHDPEVFGTGTAQLDSGASTSGQ